MTLTFVSNYINHHQKPMSDRLYERLGKDYTFIQTEDVAAERLNMGWEDLAASVPYVKKYSEDPEGCKELIANSDVVIFGGQDDESFIEPRLLLKKPVLRYSERIYKTGQWKAISPRGLKKKYHDHIRYRKDPVYLLCAGAYVASDFALIHAYPGKMIKWGYFPEIKEQDVDALMQGKKSQKGVMEILWAGRMIDWKHPEIAIEAAKYLLSQGVTDFHLTMVGGGELEEALKAMVCDPLKAHIDFAGFQSPEEVRTYMESADIYLFTSDRQEGWGAVLNEAMNSGCAVLASHEIGATPYLVKDGENGIVFKSRDQKDLNRRLYELMQKGDSESLGRAAYQTVHELWNPGVAAERLIKICEELKEGRVQTRFEEGPGSRAEVYSPRRYWCKIR
ncbi:MAG: glycosyltransferase family 4 protein [Lachnospiraceae bacterium]|nr:glycosyltransferase family 4 protein [Lachnospiraceae bacterium]